MVSVSYMINNRLFGSQDIGKIPLANLSVLVPISGVPTGKNMAQPKIQWTKNREAVWKIADPHGLVKVEDGKTLPVKLMGKFEIGEMGEKKDVKVVYVGRGCVLKLVPVGEENVKTGFRANVLLKQ
eukprot:TRINITY_DN4492_c2_g1_i1.p1 TRINITY_DN4492_c2_g1~~TRINITY_DN4492_c2_g1_i1.p1  ORF type:complete len:126 (+),score=37.52 TRINITY_DN4492_c2_g1_i1:98-475(+)